MWAKVECGRFEDRFSTIEKFPIEFPITSRHESNQKCKGKFGSLTHGGTMSKVLVAG